MSTAISTAPADRLRTPPLSLEFAEFVDVAPSRAARGARAVFEFAAAGAARAALVAAAAALSCGLFERLCWAGAPVEMPVVRLMPGLLAALFVILPVRVLPAALVGAWLGDAGGLLLPVGDEPTTVELDLAFALRYAAFGALTGGVGGALGRWAYALFRPQFEKRFLVAMPIGLLAALLGAGVSLAIAHPGPLPAGDAFVVRFFAHWLSLLVVSPPVTIWWLYAHGLSLTRAPRPREAFAFTAALALGVAGLHWHWFGSHPLFVVVANAIVLIAACVRLPSRWAVPLAAGYYVACTVLWVSASRSAATAWWGLSADSVILVQLTMTFAVSCLYLMSMTQTSRRMLEQRLREYARELALAQEDERRDAASRVRDGLAQSLVGVRLSLETIDAAGLPPAVQRALRDTLDSVRAASASADLVHREHGPQGLEDKGIVAVVESYLERLRGRGAPEFAFETAGPLAALPLATRRLAFRVVAELVGYALRNGAPTRVHVSLAARDGALRIAVEDDGGGGAMQDALGSARAAQDLFGLRERVAIEGGALALRAPRGKGATVQVTLPIVREGATRA